MRILSILGQKPGMTGSGILLKELWHCADAAGDEQRVILARYPGEQYADAFNGFYAPITYSDGPSTGDLPFPILGMSDVMPYPSLRYSQAQPVQVEAHIEAYRARLERIMATFKPDIVQIHHLWVLVALAPYCGDAQCFVTVHGTGLKQLNTAPHYARHVHEGLAHVSRFLCVSRDILDDARRAYGLPSDKTRFIGNGYNDTIFRPDGPVAAADGPVVVCAGKYVDWKGFRYLIRACGRLARPHRLVILGAGPDAERRALVREADAHNMADRLVLAGHVPQTEVAQWFRRADVFVLPSLYEPFGLVLLEAMACGCPVIASAAGGPNDIISDDLLADGLATLVAPLKETEDLDEERYVADFHAALEHHLSNSASAGSRRRIAASVAGWAWRDVYASIRSEYVKALSA